MAVSGNRKRAANVGHHLDGELVTYDDGTKGFLQHVKAAGGALGVGDLTTDAWGVQKVSLPKSLVHGLFTFDIPATAWFMYHGTTQVYTSTAITSINGAGTLITTAALPTLVLESRQCPRYQPNRGHLFSTALWCPDKTNDGVREWGLQTLENGVFFRLKADGLLYAVRKSGSVEVQEDLIDMSGVTGFDVETGNIYDIQFQWRGVGNYKFFVNNVLVHTMALLGTLQALSMENPALPISFRATRTTQDVSVHIGCADLTSENGLIDQEEYSSMYAENVAVNGTDKPVIVACNPLQINGVTNTRTVTLARISFTCSKKATFKVWAGRNSADITGATFVELGGGSYMQTDSPDTVTGAVRATAVTTTAFKLVTSVPVEAAISRSVDNPYRGRIEFPLVRGDYLIVTCTASTATAAVVIEMGEQV
jgi:hypothetical protein